MSDTVLLGIARAGLVPIWYVLLVLQLTLI